jgi:predicted O-methyltransferase YrrM
MAVTQDIVSKTNKLNIEPEITAGFQNYSMFNTGGTEVEVAEFLHGVIRMMKPDLVLETGTHLGISSSYIAHAMDQNNRGQVFTFEVIPELQNSAKELWNDLSLSNRIVSHLMDAATFDAGESMFDILFLDSEPHLRFDEFNKFWPNLRDGGLVIIHDLHPSLGHSGQTVNGVYDWPYGDFRDKIGHYIKNHDVQIISFPTPRGLTMFQKTAPGFEYTTYIKE